MSALSDEIEAAVARALRPLIARLDAQRPAGLDPMAGVSVAEAAKVAHRSPATLRRAIKAGALKASKPEDSRDWIILAADLERWMGRRRVHLRAVDTDAAVDKAVARALGGSR